MNDEKQRMSRRALLRGAAVLAGTSLTATMGGSAFAQQKASKEAMKYQDKPNGDKQCSNCLHFQPPAGCAIVEGTVAPQGYCIAWVKKV
jgi:hypothetical protein